MEAHTMSQVVLVTGCSTGIGRDLVQHLARAGHAVAATARDPDTLQDLPAALELPLDVTRAESIGPAVEQALRRLGRSRAAGGRLIRGAGWWILSRTGGERMLIQAELRRQRSTCGCAARST